MLARNNATYRAHRHIIAKATRNHIRRRGVGVVVVAAVVTWRMFNACAAAVARNSINVHQYIISNSRAYQQQRNIAPVII